MNTANAYQNSGIYSTPPVYRFAAYSMDSLVADRHRSRTRRARLSADLQLPDAAGHRLGELRRHADVRQQLDLRQFVVHVGRQHRRRRHQLRQRDEQHQHHHADPRQRHQRHRRQAAGGDVLRHRRRRGRDRTSTAADCRPHQRRQTAPITARRSRTAASRSPFSTPQYLAVPANTFYQTQRRAVPVAISARLCRPARRRTSTTHAAFGDRPRRGAVATCSTRHPADVAVATEPRAKPTTPSAKRASRRASPFWRPPHSTKKCSSSRFSS